jgi:opacity protein-like surface antigen
MRRCVVSVLAAASLSLALSNAALAADMPMATKAPPVAIVPPISWAGFYVGAHAGFAGGNATWTDVAGLVADDTTSHRLRGALGGLQLGYNVQSGMWVLGAEADFSFAGISGSSQFDAVDPVETKVRWLSTVTGRVGIASGAWLPYIKGGAVWANERMTITLVPAPGSPTTVTTETRTGWTIGGGLEYALTRNWSGRIDYGYIKLGGATAQSAFPGFPLDVKAHLHAVKFGLNYRFGG